MVRNWFGHELGFIPVNPMSSAYAYIRLGMPIAYTVLAVLVAT
jgi:hypothetical protein